jgi:hypothetical protein
MGVTLLSEQPLTCHACDAEIEGEPAGLGMLLFVRGDEVVREELPLCGRCALAISMTALDRIFFEEEEG